MIRLVCDVYDSPAATKRTVTHIKNEQYSTSIVYRPLEIEKPDMSPQRTSALDWDVWQHRGATEAAGVALWSWNVDTDVFTMDDRAHRLWGILNSGTITFEELSSRIHPEDLDKVRASFAATREVVGAYETDFRILYGGQIRWISARGRGDDQGIVGRVMFGIFIDVSVRKLVEEAREMIAEEMNHRIKNLFSIAAALTVISSRSTSTKEQMAHDLTQRLISLSAAHNLVRPGLNERFLATCSVLCSNPTRMAHPKRVAFGSRCLIYWLASPPQPHWH
jgi:two-component sensor histidine kinase